MFIFDYLEKECDSVRHGIMSVVLLKIVEPLKHIEWVEKLHGDFNIVLNLSKEDIIIKYGCRVRQGDNLAPTLFIIML